MGETRTVRILMCTDCLQLVEKLRKYDFILFLTYNYHSNPGCF